MTGRTHDTAALALLGVAAVTLPPEPMTLSTVIAALLANQIGGIAPDIDHPAAPFWRNLPIGGPVGKIVRKMLGGHRFLTHSLLGVGLLTMIGYWLLRFLQPIMPHVDTTIVLGAFVIGMVSHLLMDTITKEGVPWLLPIPVKFGFPPFERLRFTTGKMTEKLIVLPTLIILIIWLCASHYNQLVSIFQNIILD